jgi:uncharacterized membrane protein
MWSRAPAQGPLPVIRRLLRGSEWRREVLRANLWLVPAVEVVAAVVLFAGTYSLDRAAFAGDFGLPGWVLSGSPDAARQILIAIAAAIITVVVVVSFMVIVALALASGQFGPLMLRNFIRDRGTQVTLGTFVATFVYAVLALGAIGEGGPGFVPHISVTVTLALTVADLAVLVYFVDHITTQIQLPQVIAGIAGDLAEAIELQAGRGAAGLGARSAARLLAGMDGPGGEVAAPRSGYLQYIQHALLARLASERGVVIHLRCRPGHFLMQGRAYATVWPADAAERVAHDLSRAQVTGPYRALVQDVSFGIDQLAEIAIRALSPAVNDTFTALACIDWIGDSLCRVTGRWHPIRVYRDAAGVVRVITTEATYERLVQRAFEKVRQAGTGMPAVMIRQLDALAKIMEGTTAPKDRQLLLDQAAMIGRLSLSSVAEESDQADIQRAYQAVLRVHAGFPGTHTAPRGAGRGSPAAQAP